MKSTLIIGSSVCDVNIYVQQFPQITGDENIIKQEMTMGGCAWNVSAVLDNYSFLILFFHPLAKDSMVILSKPSFKKIMFLF